MTLEIGEIVSLSLSVGCVAGLIVLGRDMLKLAARVERVTLEEHQIEEHVGREEHVRHDETEQLRRDVDDLALRLRDKIDQKKARQVHPVRETLEGAFAPPSQPGDTRVWSPNEPKLPRFESFRERLDCSHRIVAMGQCMNCGREM